MTAGAGLVSQALSDAVGVADTSRVLSNPAALLVQGAHLAIVDLDEEDGGFHGDGVDRHQIVRDPLSRDRHTDVDTARARILAA